MPAKAKARAKAEARPCLLAISFKSASTCSVNFPRNIALVQPVQVGDNQFVNTKFSKPILVILRSSLQREGGRGAINKMTEE